MHIPSQSPRLKGMVVGLYAAFWGLMTHALSANTFIIVRIAEPFWFLVALTVLLRSLSMEDTANSDETNTKEDNIYNT